VANKKRNRNGSSQAAGNAGIVASLTQKHDAGLIDDESYSNALAQLGSLEPEQGSTKAVYTEQKEFPYRTTPNAVHYVRVSTKVKNGIQTSGLSIGFTRQDGTDIPKRFIYGEDVPAFLKAATAAGKELAKMSK